MTWAIDLAEAQAAGCTIAELEALELATKGLSTRTISLALNVSRSAVRSRLENARRKIHNAKGEAA